MKHILIAVSSLVVVALIIVACRTTPPQVTNPPPAPAAAGCSVTISSIPGRVSAMTWSNATTGHSGSGVASITPEFGSSGSIFADSSVSCPTSAIPIAGATFVCKGTNMPYAQLLILAYNAGGLHFQVSTGDCATCSFNVSKDADYWCNIYAPKK